MNIFISNSSKIPIYRQIVNQIKKSILNDTLKYGDYLPSIRSLARELSISVITTKRSYEELENLGLIKSIPGKGFYISIENKEILLKEQTKSIEKKLLGIIKESKLIGLTLNDLENLLKSLY